MPKHIESLLAFVFMGGGAASLFFSIMLLKPILSAHDYGSFAGFITLILIIGAVGLLSYEQSLLRVAQLNLPGFGLPKNNLPITLGVAVVTSCAASYVFKKFFSQESSVVKVFAVCMLISISLYLSSMERLRARYIESQIASNLWKIIFFGVVVAQHRSGDFLEYAEVETVAVMSCALGLAIALVTKKFRQPYKTDIVRDSDRFNKNDAGMAFLTATYLFSTSLIVAVNNFDKFYIDMILGKERLGEYFHLITIYTYPFLLFSNLIGLRLLVEFKTNFSFERLVSNILKTLVWLVPVMLFYCVSIFLYEGWRDAEYYGNFKLVIVLVLIAIARVVYSIISAAAGAVGSSKNISIANIIFVLFLSAILVLIRESLHTAVHVASLLLVLLIFRAASYLITLRYEKYA